MTDYNSYAYYARVNQIAHIRKELFKMDPKAFADAVGVTQPTVWRWENGSEPGRDNLERIRNAALEREIPWDDSVFFEEPPLSESREDAESERQAS